MVPKASLSYRLRVKQATIMENEAASSYTRRCVFQAYLPLKNLSRSIDLSLSTDSGLTQHGCSVFLESVMVSE